MHNDILSIRLPIGSEGDAAHGSKCHIHAMRSKEFLESMVPAVSTSTESVALLFADLQSFSAVPGGYSKSSAPIVLSRTSLGLSLSQSSLSGEVKEDEIFRLCKFSFDKLLAGPVLWYSKT